MKPQPQVRRSFAEVVGINTSGSPSGMPSGFPSGTNTNAVSISKPRQDKTAYKVSLMNLNNNAEQMTKSVFHGTGGNDANIYCGLYKAQAVHINRYPKDSYDINFMKDYMIVKKDGTEDIVSVNYKDGMVGYELKIPIALNLSELEIQRFIELCNRRLKEDVMNIVDEDIYAEIGNPYDDEGTYLINEEANEKGIRMRELSIWVKFPIDCDRCRYQMNRIHLNQRN
jgi:hypothetical protein